MDLDQRRRRQADFALPVGSRLGPYVIQRVLAEGGYGDVYEAKHEVLGRHVALKILQDRHADRDDLQRRLALEARVFSEIKSPYMVTVYDAGTYDSRVWMAMEFVQGRTLREELVPPQPLPILRALNIAACIASGVGEAHSLRVVHRDLKPENVMVTPDGHIVVLDLGTAKILSDKRGKDTQRVMGTPAYMSVEHLLGPKDGLPIDQRTDVYAVAVMLYEMLSGVHPFAYDRSRSAFLPPPQVIRRVVEAPVEPLREVAPQVPDYVARIVEKGLSRDREFRQTTMQELETELRLAARWFVEDRALSERRARTPRGGNIAAAAERRGTVPQRPLHAVAHQNEIHEDCDDTDPDLMCRPPEDATLEERGTHAVAADPAGMFARSGRAGSLRMATERLTDPDQPERHAPTRTPGSTRTTPALRNDNAAESAVLTPQGSGALSRAMQILAHPGRMLASAMDWLKTNYATLCTLIATRQVSRAMIAAPVAGAVIGLGAVVLLNQLKKPAANPPAQHATQARADQADEAEQQAPRAAPLAAVASAPVTAAQTTASPPNPTASVSKPQTPAPPPAAPAKPRKTAKKGRPPLVPDELIFPGKEPPFSADEVLLPGRTGPSAAPKPKSPAKPKRPSETEKDVLPFDGPIF